MEIRRVNEYGDKRFRHTVLCQHGAFLVDGQPWEFEITEPGSAVVFWDGPAGQEVLDGVIGEFRSYAGQIVRFYDREGRLLREFPPVPVFEVTLESIQPSQFFVDEDKLRAVADFVHSPRDVVVPVIPNETGEGYISLDGHTRLALALERGWSTVYGFLDRDWGGVMDFVDEARRRGVFGVKDVQRLPHARYIVEWDGFCDSFFGRI